MEETVVEEQQSTTIADANPSTQQPQPTLADLQATLYQREAELSDAQGILAQRDAELQALRGQLASATARYRQALLASAPEIPEELVSGHTPEEVEASLAQARQMVERIRSRIEARQTEQRVPTGAPIRSGADISTMSARGKIAYALAQQHGR